MTKLDTICRRLHDLGIFLLGVSAVVACTYLIYERTHSPYREMEATIQREMSEAFRHGYDSVNHP